MKQLFEDLWETGVESPFPGLTTHAYLLGRDTGNVLFYNTSQQADIKQMGNWVVWPGIFSVIAMNWVSR